MYAVIKTGGKQYRVSPGDVVRVEKLPVEEGATVNLEEVLMISNGDQVKIGKPLVEGANVTATVRGHGRDKKIRIFKLRRRKDSRLHAGHRQSYTELEVTGITGA